MQSLLRIVDCLVSDHNLWLVGVAALICGVGVLAVMLSIGRATASTRGWQWSVVAAISAAAAIWSTHFVAMLAYLQDVEARFDLSWTIISFVVGAVPILAGVCLAVKNRTSHKMIVAAGMLVGGGVVALHYVGMAAVQFSGRTLRYDGDLVAVSILLSLGLGVAAMHFAVRSAGANARRLGALMLLLMTVSLHFTAMGAAQLDLDPYQFTIPDSIARPTLAFLVTLASIGVLSVAAVLATADLRISQQTAADAERFRTLADGAFEGIVIHRDGRILDCNPALLEIFQARDRADIGCLHDIVSASTLLSVMAEAGTPREIDLKRIGGAFFQAEVCGRSIRLPDGEYGDLISIRDVSARKRAEAQLSHLAMHDQVTDLPNRRLFVELAEKHLAHARRHGKQFAIHMIDLDGFKLVNDMHGHEAGDALLRAVSGRFGASLREEDVVARFGGDEFAVLETGTHQPSDAAAVADRLIGQVRLPVRLDAGEVTVGCSIGIAVYPDDGATIEALLRNADTAMYRAKADGKGDFRFYEEAMDAAQIVRRRLEHRLRAAIAEEKLEIAYQPLVDSRDHRLLGFKSLVRWSDPELGPVSPATFIPVAEETGLIIPLGEFVLRRACRDAAAWPDHLRVAINLSSVQFRRVGLADTVRRALADSGLPGDRLDLEITESILIDNREMVLAILQDLKSMGIRISMDDFGTGYSSLSYLQSFPFDKIKIDRVFIKDLEGSLQNSSIVQAVIAMGRSLSMKVVAEGVETLGQAEMLCGMDCDELQGYLIAKPMSGADATAYIGEDAARQIGRTAA